MNPRLPPGVRDYLPVAAARRRGLASTAAAEIERWGYRGIITPLYEYAEVLARGTSAAAAQAMRFVEPASGEVVALRPDLTPQVARLVATRMHDEAGPVRLYYQGSVVRLDGGRREIFQIGVELIDAPQPGGDLEVVALAEAALQALGIAEYTVDLGHAAVVRAALDSLGLDDEAMAALQLALMRKDGAAVAALATLARVSEGRKALLCALPTLYGGPEVLARARTLVEDPAARDGVDELELLCARLGALGPASRLSIDLGEVRGFDYYTGTRFGLYAEGAGGALASGGRYDGLVARYGRPARAAGFALDVDRTAELLRVRGVPAPRQPGGVLVAGEPVAAARAAAELRQKGERAVLDLDEPAASDGELLRRAAVRELGRVAVAGPAGIRWLNEGS
jgi:ATP phosphoribosyltransferase regulatory subunit